MPDCKPQLSGWEISLLEADHVDEDHVLHSSIKCLFSNASEPGTILSVRDKLMNKINISTLMELANLRVTINTPV